MLKPNELMTWDEMVKRYPAQWVFVEITKGDDANIEKGIVRAVSEDDSLAEAWKYCASQGWDFTYKRTTVEPFMGIVDGVNFSITSEEVFSNEP